MGTAVSPMRPRLTYPPRALAPLLPTTIGNGLIMLTPPDHIPPYATFANITASAAGTIIGSGTMVNAEADWGGFQLRAVVPEPSTLLLTASGLLGLLGYAWRRRK